VDAESTALASTAAATVVTLLTTDAWGQVKKEIGGLWRRFRPSQADAVEADLTEARQEALAGDEAVARMLIAEWESRLRRLLAADSAVADELARVIGTLAGGPPGDERTTVIQHAESSGHGTIVQAGRDARIGGPC
jgi:hypothetical protein